MAKASRRADRKTSSLKTVPKGRRTPGKKSSTRANTGISTEEKIMQAAKKLFTQKGFAATRTRDIAEEAGINLALLNYYFRSKEKLFDIVMLDNFRQFIKGVSVNLLDETATFDEKITRIVTAYIDFLSRHPDLPLFILNEIKGNPSVLLQRISSEITPLRSHMFRQLQDAGKQGKINPIDPFHFIANLIGLTVFPFVARPLLQRVTGVSDQQFQDFIQERKALVPMWISTIMHAKK